MTKQEMTKQTLDLEISDEKSTCSGTTQCMKSATVMYTKAGVSKHVDYTVMDLEIPIRMRY
jgi:hypothetical protein